MSLAMWVVVTGVQTLVGTAALKLAAGVTTGVVFYAGVSRLFRFLELKEMTDILAAASWLPQKR